MKTNAAKRNKQQALPKRRSTFLSWPTSYLIPSTIWKSCLSLYSASPPSSTAWSPSSKSCTEFS